MVWIIGGIGVVIIIRKTYAVSAVLGVHHYDLKLNGWHAAVVQISSCTSHNPGNALTLSSMKVLFILAVVNSTWILISDLTYLM